MKTGGFFKKHQFLLTAVLSSAATFFVFRQSTKSVTKKNKELERLNGLKTEVMAACSHDMKSPIQATMLMLELLMMEQDGKLTAEQKITLESIRKNEEELMRLITNLLDLARREDGALNLRTDRRDIRALIEGWSNRQRVLTNKKGLDFKVEIEYGVGPLVYEVDSFKILQVLNNLMSNALKFTPPGREIKLTAGKTLKGHLRVSLFNSGTAIAKDKLTVIFNRYAQASDGAEAKDGTGLGLSIAKSIIEMHGGRIWAKGIAGKGNIFTFTLPPKGHAIEEPHGEKRPGLSLQSAIMALLTSSKGGTKPRHDASGLSSRSTTSMVGVVITP